MNQFYVYSQRSLKVKAVSPKKNCDKMLYLWMNLQKLFDQNPQSEFFRVLTSMFVGKDLTYVWFEYSFRGNSFCVRFVTQLEISKISIKTSIESTLMFSLWGCLSDTWFWKFILGRNSFCVRFVTQLQEWTLMFSLSWFWSDKFWILM